MQEVVRLGAKEQALCPQTDATTLAGVEIEEPRSCELGSLEGCDSVPQHQNKFAPAQLDSSPLMFHIVPVTHVAAFGATLPGGAYAENWKDPP